MSKSNPSSPPSDKAANKDNHTQQPNEPYCVLTRIEDATYLRLAEYSIPIFEQYAFRCYRRDTPEVLEKTADGVPDPFANRILNLSSHSAHAGEEVAEIEDSDKERLAELVSFLSKTYRFKKQEAANV